MTESNKKTAPIYQVLLLDNDSSQNVEVHEAENVDFSKVKMHLQSGGSVFITSRATQKLLPSFKAQTNYNRSRKTLGILFHQHLRSQ
ncbi:MAG: hypothetical protein NWE93_05445 [Candidatus Bathyarchaeota archaeon]|nr:hypothetical protein [Candidatus Bathyarchaeota archaeon]